MDTSKNRTRSSTSNDESDKTKESVGSPDDDAQVYQMRPNLENKFVLMFYLYQNLTFYFNYSFIYTKNVIITRFKPMKAKELIHNILYDYLSNKSYNAAEAQVWTKELANTIRIKMKGT